jgi:hypothetical protein
MKHIVEETTNRREKNKSSKISSERGNRDRQKERKDSRIDHQEIVRGEKSNQNSF